MADIQSLLNDLLIKRTGLGSITLEIPPEGLGDYAFPCFSLAKTQKKNPALIAQELAASITADFIEKTEAKGAYVNFFISRSHLADSIITNVLRKRMAYGKPALSAQRIMVEFSAPNTNKPMHLGHVRNNFLGDAVCKILAYGGHHVIRANLINDRGVHICKAMVAYEKWGNGKTPQQSGQKGDSFVGHYYVLFSQRAKENPALEEEALAMLRKWEAGDKKVQALWKRMRSWVLKGFMTTYKSMDIAFDHVYYESDIYMHGKEMVMDALEKQQLRKDESGNIIVDLQEFGMGDKVVLRADGTSIYITQDLFLAKKKFDDYHLDKSIYVVGNEQDLHFRMLFATLTKMGYDIGSKSLHLSYGMVNLPEGKMKSREGTVVDADDLLAETISLAREEVIKRDVKLSRSEADKRSKAIALGALRFFILKNDPARDMLYDPKEAISFEGETGPYVQYTHARISSILAKAPKKSMKANHALLTTEEEKNLLLQLSRYPSAVAEAEKNLRPSVIAHYALELSQTFNNFYHKHTVLSEDAGLTAARLDLIRAVQQVIQNSLSLLGIHALKRM